MFYRKVAAWFITYVTLVEGFRLYFLLGRCLGRVLASESCLKFWLVHLLVLCTLPNLFDAHFSFNFGFGGLVHLGVKVVKQRIRSWIILFLVSKDDFPGKLTACCRLF